MMDEYYIQCSTTDLGEGVSDKAEVIEGSGIVPISYAIIMTENILLHGKFEIMWSHHCSLKTNFPEFCW